MTAVIDSSRAIADNSGILWWSGIVFYEVKSMSAIAFNQERQKLDASLISIRKMQLLLSIKVGVSQEKNFLLFVAN